MKLPEIDFNAPVPDSSRAPLMADEARRRAFQVVQKGLEAFGQELAKSQRQRAGADLAQSLNDIEAELDANPTVSTKWIKERLGGSLDGLPPELRSQVTEQGLDLNTGEIVEMDKEDIPSWIVASHIYDARSKQAISSATRNVSMGQAADFEEAARAEVITRKAKINERAMKAGLQYMMQTQTESALTLANAGRFDGPGGARDTVEKSRAMDPAYKAKLMEHIDKIEQVRPVYEALQRDDYATMTEFIGKLNDPKEFSKLEPQERAAFSDRLKSEVKQFQERIKKEKDDTLKRNATEFVDATGQRTGWNPIFEKVREGKAVSYRDIPPPGTIAPDEQKQMIEYIDNRRKGVEPKTDLTLYAALTDLARNKPEEFASLSIPALINRLSPADFKHFVDLQAKPPGASQFDDFVSTDEAINSKLSAPTEQGGYGFDLKKMKDDSEIQGQVGHLKSLIQHEIAALGHRPSLTERDDIIERVLKNEVQTTKHWWRSDERKVSTLGVPPKYVVALRRVSADLGYGLSAEGLKQTYTDFAFYESGITQAWGPLAGTRRKLTPDLALGAYGYLKANWSAIDAELRRVGKLTGNNEIDNANRTALAVQGFLSQTR
jgi:hypothetical protein